MRSSIGVLESVNPVRLRAERARAARLSERAQVQLAIERGVYLDLQSVCNIDVRTEVLYQECLSRIFNDARTCMPAEFLPQVATRGLARWFDVLIVQRALSALRASPELALGCNVFGSSAVDDELWADTFEQLEACPEIAARLVIEITETEPVDAMKARAFVRRMRRLGCRIAIDDFGVRYGVETAIAITQPDVIKIDASFIEGARRSEAGVGRLRGIVSLAEDMASEVVIEGVETFEDLDLARFAGARWVQGYLLCDESRRF